jgi:hypothetical protein
MTKMTIEGFASGPHQRRTIRPLANRASPPPPLLLTLSSVPELHRSTCNPRVNMCGNHVSSSCKDRCCPQGVRAGRGPPAPNSMWPRVRCAVDAFSGWLVSCRQDLLAHTRIALDRFGGASILEPQRRLQPPCAMLLGGGRNGWWETDFRPGRVRLRPPAHPPLSHTHHIRSNTQINNITHAVCPRSPQLYFYTQCSHRFVEEKRLLAPVVFAIDIKQGRQQPHVPQRLLRDKDRGGRGRLQKERARTPRDGALACQRQGEG